MTKGQIFRRKRNNVIRKAYKELRRKGNKGEVAAMKLKELYGLSIVTIWRAIKK